MVNTFKKSFAGLMIAAFVFAGATPAKAQTAAELQALVNQLLAQIANMSGNSCSGSYTHTVTLRQGMNGSQVAAMQAVVGATADGNFGPMTASAVRSFQTSKGLTADGVVGAMTGAAMASASANCGNNNDNGGSNNTGDLDGDFGTIHDVSELSQYSDEEVGEGEEDVEVLGFEIEATNDGDIEIDSVRVSFDPSTSTGSDNLDDYVSEVTVWFDGEKVASADVDDFSQNSSDVYTKTMALDSGVVVRSDDTEKFIVAVSAANTFDSSDISGDAWKVDVDNVRFIDGSGVVTTEDGYDLGSMDVEIDFVSFSTAADTELKISTDSDSPEADVVIVDDSSSTDDVVLLKGKLKLEGDSDVVLDEMPVTFTATGANINVITESLKLEIGGEEYTESVSTLTGTTGTLTFDNLDLDIEAGDTVEFTVMADMTDMDGTVFAEGDTLKADVTSTNRDYMDVENSEGDQLSDSSEKSGTATGEAQEFRTEGIMVTLVSTSSDVTTGNSTNDDLGEFTIKFKVKAMGDAVYISSLAAASLTTANTGASAGVERSGTATIGGVSATIVNTTDEDMTVVGNYLIEDGEEETFEMTVTAQLPTVGSAGQYRALLRGLDWDIDDDATPDQTYTSNLDSFKTSYKALN